MTDKLLPCPFCGADPYFSQPVVGSECFEVSCNGDDCGVMGPMFKSKELAAEVWNRRTMPPEPHVTADNQPRCTTKRLHDEIAKARAYGLEMAAAYHDDIAASHAASHANVVSDFHEMMERQHKRDASAIRALATTEGSDR